MATIDTMAKHLFNIENNIARYIYNKYIIPKTITIPNNITPPEYNISRDMKAVSAEVEAVSAEVEAGGVEVVKMNDKYIKIYKKTLYKKYLQTIFDFKRKTGRILQNDILKIDLHNIDIATKAYEHSPKTFNPNDYESLPDTLRCTFIRKSKHRYYRCKNKIINDDNDICKLHDNIDNIYFDKYNEICTKLQQPLITN